MEKKKEKRARTKEAKKKQYEKILDAGRKLFLKYGSEGLSMRTLAKEVNMGKSNLYTYVQSKRELWFAVMQRDFEQFERGMEKEFSEHKGTYKELIKKVGRFYLEFAKEDKARYQMMFQTPAPPSKTVGPIEEEYESKSIFYLKDLIQAAANNGEIAEKDVDKLTYFLWGIVHGTSNVIDTDLFGGKDRIPDYGNLDEYYDFVMKYITKILDIL